MTMPKEPFSAEPEYDAASAISIGGRSCQEDAIITDFPKGAGVGLAVLSDGMGGHAAGDVASKIVVTEVFSELKLRTGNRDGFERDMRRILCDAAQIANECVLSHAMTHPATCGMGATLLAVVLIGDRLHWISIGDSPLLLFRDGQLSRLNEDHSLAPQIDHLVRVGRISPERGRNHPDRNCLTSVLIGLEIPRIDCPGRPLQLGPGDVVLAATDGLECLDRHAMSSLLRDLSGASSAQIAAAFMERIESVADPDQDNVALAVIRPEQPVEQADVATTAAHAPETESVAAALHRPLCGGTKLSVAAVRSRSGMAMMCRVSGAADPQS